jgi:hypothetical protein
MMSVMFEFSTFEHLYLIRISVTVYQYLNYL